MKSEPSGCLTLKMPMIGTCGPIASRIAVMSATPSARIPTAPPAIAALAIAAMNAVRGADCPPAPDKKRPARPAAGRALPARRLAIHASRSCYPLMLDIVSASMKLRWRTRKTIKTGSIAIKATAISCG